MLITELVCLIPDYFMSTSARSAYPPRRTCECYLRVLRRETLGMTKPIGNHCVSLVIHELCSFGHPRHIQSAARPSYLGFGGAERSRADEGFRACDRSGTSVPLAPPARGRETDRKPRCCRGGGGHTNQVRARSDTANRDTSSCFYHFAPGSPRPAASAAPTDCILPMLVSVMTVDEHIVMNTS